jgi:outer membrane protein OmpA-like peptidoglycan-associated protein
MSQTQRHAPFDLRARLSRIGPAVFLGLGGADLAILNVWILPALLTATDMSPSRRSVEPTERSALVTPAANGPAAVVAGTAQHETADGEPAQPQPTAAERARVRIMFGTGNWWIGPHGKQALLGLANDLGAASQQIEVIGHADSPGTRAVNQRISELRAQAVAALLIREGVDESRIHVRGVGEDEPSRDGYDRRVEIWLGGVR